MKEAARCENATLMNDPLGKLNYKRLLLLLSRLLIIKSFDPKERRTSAESPTARSDHM
jgi:hypothetical protein